MSHVYNAHTEIAAQIERLELESKDLRRRMDRAAYEPDKRILARQLDDLGEQIEGLRERLA
jgi:hypothetical protein